MIKFLSLEEPPINIFRRLQKIYGDAVIAATLSKSGHPGSKIKKISVQLTSEINEEVDDNL